MSASRVAERHAAYALQTTMQPAITTSFDLLATAPQGVAKLRELILSLAVRGKLVEQKSSEKSASHLLERVHVERIALEGSGRKKRDNAAMHEHNDAWAELPNHWVWTCLAEIGVINPRNDVPDDLQASFVQMSSIPVALLEPHKTESRPWREIRSGFTHFSEGDVGVAKITPCFENGKSTIFRNLDGGVGAGTTELHIVRPLASIDPGYILIFLKSPEFLRPGEACMTGSAGQKRLARRYFETRALPLPPLAEQARIVARVDELMQLCDALEAHGRLQDEQHARLVARLFDALATSAFAKELAENWQRLATHFDLLLDRPEAVDALEQAVLQLAVRGLLVSQNPTDEHASKLIQKIQACRAELRETAGNSKRAAWHNEPTFNLPTGWEAVGLLDVCSVGGGATPSKGNPGYWNGDIPWVSPKDMKVDLIEDSQDHISPKALNETRLPLVATNSLLVVVRGMILVHSFPVAVTTREVTLNQDMKSFTPYLGGLTDFLALALKGFKPEILSLVARSTHGTCKLESEKLFGFTFGLPPLAEQQRIVARVEQLRGLCAELRERLQQSRVTQSRLAEALVMQAET